MAHSLMKSRTKFEYDGSHVCFQLGGGLTRVLFGMQRPRIGVKLIQFAIHL